MHTLTKKQNSYGKVFLLSLLGTALIFVPFILYNGGIFLYAGDYNVQQIPFYQLAGQAVQNGNFFWNWGTDLGVNFLGTYSFYLLGSPFFWLTAFLDSGIIPYLMGPLLMLKISLSAVTAYAFIRRFTQKDESAVIGGLLYAFSSFSIYNIFFNHFHEVILTFPLLLLALELYMTEGKRCFFGCMVALCAVTNYFFFVGEVVFLILYFVIRVISGSFTLTWHKFFSLAFESVAGVGIAAILLLPAVLAIMGNPRLAETTGGLRWLMYGNPQQYGSIWMNLFFPAEVPYAPNFFADADVKWKSIAAYLPMFSMCGVFAWCMSKYGSWLRRVLVTCLAMAMVPILNSAFILFNPSYYARWFYMPVLIMALTTVLAFERLENEELIKGIKYTAVWTVLLSLVSIIPDIWEDGFVELCALCDHPVRFWIGACIAFMGLCCTALYAERVHRNGAPDLRFAAIGILVSVVLSSWVFMADGKNAKYWDDYYIDNCLNVNSSVTLPTGDDFCRYDFQNCEDNQGMFFGVPSVNAFNSVVPASIMEYYPYVGIKRDVSSKPDAYHHWTRALTSVRYLVADKEDEYEVVYGFDHIDTQGQFDIYENRYYIPMGFTYDKLISRSLLDTADAYQRGGIMLGALCIEDEDLDIAAKYLTSVTSDDLYTAQDYQKYAQDCADRKQTCGDSFVTTGDGFVSTITMDRENLVFYSVPYDAGWSATVNGEPAQIIKANVGFMAVVCPEGACTVEFTYVSPGFTAGAVITAVSALSMVAYGFFMTRYDKKRCPLQEDPQ